ncbi:MAG: pyruvate ferredoxin oxidoreductase [Thermoplasmata archaeon]|nr:MAG: pyruvate ferredoxin oxidoreductase [Thermoplasmata archaeon]
MMRVVTGNYAAAYAAMRARAEVVAAYPITPQTFIVEHIAEFINNGEMDAEYMAVESEHSAMSAIISAEATGVRTFTATSSQGLALMHEMLFIPPALRLPIVMAVVNRTVAAPIGIWCEYNDAMPQRDTGWMMVFVENNQEVFDMIIQAYKIAENSDVLLPMMVCLDAFILSHTVEPVSLEEQEAVDEFLPKYKPHVYLLPEDPMAVGTFTPPEYIQEVRYQEDVAMRNARRVIARVDEEFGEKFGRKYHGLVEKYMVDDADVVLITLGTVTSTAREIVHKLRDKGKKVGLVKLRFMRPFPEQELREIAENVKAIGVYDRSVSFGSGGPAYIEVRNALYGFDIPVINFLAGIGGRDVMAPDINLMFEKLYMAADGAEKKNIIWIGTRGVEP